MSRRIRSLVSLLLVTFALGFTVSACADASGPSTETACDNNNPITCK